MKEKEFIEIIKTTLNSEYIGDDCAYLKDLGIVVSQDSLVEDVHFSLKYATPYQLGYKSVAVNISDICASGAEPKYLTIALSMPNNISKDFVEQFYKGADTAADGVKIVGGDITGADKIYISVTAIGKTLGRKISSRSNAKVGQKIVISGNHGSSSAGLKLLKGAEFPNLNQKEKEDFINAHLMPQAQTEFSKKVAMYQKSDYGMMDTSDGLADALYSIAMASNVMLDVNFNKVPHLSSLENISNYENYILYGGEDYGLVATVDNPCDMIVIGEVKEGRGVKINYSNRTEILTKETVEKNLYNHFKE